MIDRSHDLPVVRQCQVLCLHRSTAYYVAQPVGEIDLILMRQIDELYLDHPFAGSTGYAASHRSCCWSQACGNPNEKDGYRGAI